MAYGIRTVNSDLKHYDFTWDISIGAINTAPDWRPTAKCGNGLHFCAVGDDFTYLQHGTLIVIEYDESKAIDLDGKHKVKTCKVVCVVEDEDDLTEFYKYYPLPSNITNADAYKWAYHIGNQEHMRQFITDPEWAYFWAQEIGDHAYMRQFITESKWAYLWARDIGDKEHMRQFVTDPEWAHCWAKDIADPEMFNDAD